MEGLWLEFSGLVIQYCHNSDVFALVRRLAFEGAKGSGLLLRFRLEHLSLGLQDLSVISF